MYWMMKMKKIKYINGEKYIGTKITPIKILDKIYLDNLFYYEPEDYYEIEKDFYEEEEEPEFREYTNITLALFDYSCTVNYYFLCDTIKEFDPTQKDSEFGRGYKYNYNRNKIDDFIYSLTPRKSIDFLNYIETKRLKESTWWWYLVNTETYREFSVCRGNLQIVVS